MKTTDKPIIVEQIFNKSLGEVWKSITEIDLMKRWFFDNIPEFRPEVGFKTEFSIISSERRFIHKWHVTEVIPNERIVYNWQYEDYKGSMDVHFELFASYISVKLRVMVNVLEDFSEDIPEFERESCENGWKYFINEKLNAYLNG